MTPINASARRPQPARLLPRALGAAVLVTSLSTAALVRADDPDDPAAPDLPALSASSADGEDRVTALEERVDELAAQLRASEEERRASTSSLTWGGYVDAGFFVPLGNGGVGFVRDVGNTQFPQYAPDGAMPYAWTFLGDILGSPVNSRGEAADLGNPPGITRFDSVDSGGAPGFLINEINLRPRYALAETAILRASVNLVPRSGVNFSFGDFVDVDLAEMEYVVTKDGKTSVFVGKILPVFGIEYKDRKSDQRFGITPSLVSRYTSGTQLGLKVRSKLFSDWLILAAAVTNNSSTVESFHFYREIDRNIGKTLNGRAALSVPVGDLLHLGGDRLEVGLSGEWGPQDGASDNSGDIWFAGGDLQYLSANYTVKGQLLRGGAPGRADEGVWKLDLRYSGYLELDWQLLARFGIIARAEIRDASVSLGTERLYLTKQARFTGGVRVVFNPHIVLKAEYLHNREYGGIAQIDNDVATSSLVLAF
jgi:hypothetical protein